MNTENNFNVALEKVMNIDISNIFWSNLMDLIAMITRNHALEVHRISFKSQKVFQIEEKTNICNVMFSPDGQSLAYSCQEGKITIVKTENGEKLYIMGNKLNYFNIVHINWNIYSNINHIDEINPIKKSSLADKLIMQISPHIFSDKANVAKLRYYYEYCLNFSVMISSDSATNITLSLNGIQCISKFNLSNFLNNIQKGDPEIISTFISNENSIINVLFCCEDANKFNDLYLLSIDSSILNQYKTEIITIGFIFSYVEDILFFLKNTVTSIFNQLKDLSKMFSNKLMILEDLLKANNVNLSTNEELLRYLKSGVYSNALLHFLSKEIYDTKILQKMDENLNLTFNNIHEFLLESFQNVIQRVMILLNTLINFSQYEERYKILGMNFKLLKEIESLFIKLSILSEKLLLDSAETKLNIRNLLVWLNKSVIKTIQENETEIENNKSYLNKYSVDIERLYKMLEDSELFQMKNLLNFFIVDKNKKDNKENVQNIQEINFQSQNKNQTNKNYKNIFKENSFKEIEKLKKSFKNNKINDSEKDNLKQFYINNYNNNKIEESFFDLLKLIELKWADIVKKPQERNYEVENEVIIISPQELINEYYTVGFSRRINNKDILHLSKFYEENTIQKKSFSIFSLSVPNGFELKEAIFGKNEEIFVLLKENTYSHPKSNFIIAALNISMTKNSGPLIKIESSDSIQIHDISLILNSVLIEEMKFKKYYRLEGVNVGKLRASLKGLISVIVEENKLVILDDS